MKPNNAHPHHHHAHSEPDRDQVKRPVEARQGTGPRSMFNVLAISLALCGIAALVLAYAYI